MLVPLRVSVTFSFNRAASHHHCPELAHVAGRGWRGVLEREREGGSVFVLKKQNKKRKGGVTILHPPRDLPQNTKIITRASKYAMFEMIFLFVVAA